MSESSRAVMTEVKISDLEPDAENANEGTERGSAMIEASLREVGAGRSLVLDKRGRVIAGNKTLNAAASIGLDDVVIVHTNGKKLVAVQRDDLDLDEDRARRLALYDNRTSEVDLVWSAEVLEAQEHLLQGLFSEAELEKIYADAQKSLEELDLDGFKPLSDVAISYKVSVSALDLEAATALRDELQARSMQVSIEQVRE